MVGTARTVVTGDRRSGGAIGHWRSFMDVVITGIVTIIGVIATATVAG